MDRSKALGEENIGKLLWKFSLPAIIGMLVNALYNVIDSIFVGRGVGEIGLAAVTISFPIMLILMGSGMLVGIGAAALVSIRMGQKRQDEAEKILGNAVSMLVVISIFVSSLALIFLDPILLKLGAERQVLPYARDFTRIILAGSIFMYLGFGLNNMIRSEGNPKTAMATMLISAVINTILNPIFIFGLKMGISGSAWATVIAQAVSAIWVLAYFLGKRSLLKLRWANLKPDGVIIMEITKIGMSPFLMQIAASLVTVVMNTSLLKYGGELAVASSGIINRFAMLLLMPIVGVSAGVQPIIGYNFGAQNHHRVIEAVKKASWVATGISVFAFVVAELFYTPIVSLFNKSPELIAIGSNGLRIVFFMFPIVGFQFIGSNYFQAVGKAKYAIFLSLSRQVIILIPLIYILPRIWGLNGVWIASPISDFGSAVLTAIFLYRELRIMRLQPKEGAN